ncbi:conserved hypothetical protein [Perkinsus marinus ATCC 50983]|uniref:Guanylate cyclase domain-containing protein n=1 Tax=Perkinsus marinus (strain ATCC 50983 / TXsc) TaxID=423536 RepID=C5KZP8_PERM5|nr:conserved hypothetical protein [Perkinsus marinus ATCC 50983]EER10076.1 conserved hypothetical protein [Perkinsus marinus ATCC 50983]|eukprot:XP_002778281.1 conserved hypothetical protein [Perkinsus marinus ATCC 50983]
MPRKISVVRLKEINNQREKAKKELTERALLGCIKIIAEIRRAGDLKAYAKHPKLIPKFGLAYQVDVGIALHSGWSVEGAIGSEMKIDATYIGFNVSVARSLLKALPLYGCSLLLTESVVENLGNKTRDRCRLIDEVMVGEVGRTPKKETKCGIYSFDINAQVPEAPENHSRVGKVIPRTDGVLENFDVNVVEHLFEVDKDVQILQEGYTDELRNLWRQA